MTTAEWPSMVLCRSRVQAAGAFMLVVLACSSGYAQDDGRQNQSGQAEGPDAADPLQLELARHATCLVPPVAIEVTWSQHYMLKDTSRLPRDKSGQLPPNIDASEGRRVNRVGQVALLRDNVVEARETRPALYPDGEFRDVTRHVLVEAEAALLINDERMTGLLLPRASATRSDVPAGIQEPDLLHASIARPVLDLVDFLGRLRKILDGCSRCATGEHEVVLPSPTSFLTPAPRVIRLHAALQSESSGRQSPEEETTPTLLVQGFDETQALRVELRVRDAPCGIVYDYSIFRPTGEHAIQRRVTIDFYSPSTTALYQMPIQKIAEQLTIADR